MRWGSKVQWGKTTCYNSLDWPNWDKANLYCLKTKIREHCFESCNFEGWGNGSVASVFTQQALRTLSLDTPSSWKSWAWQQAHCCGLWIGRRGGLWRSLASQSKTCSRLNKRPCLKNKIKKKKWRHDRGAIWVRHPLLAFWAQAWRHAHMYTYACTTWTHPVFLSSFFLDPYFRK